MTEAAGSAEGAGDPGRTVESIYEPVRAGLDAVEDNLRKLASESGLLGDASLLDHALGSGGKKVRPAVTLLAGASRPGREDVLVTMATAVELLHIASLIHDDSVDKADTRRGRSTISRTWGENIALLLGDYVFATSAVFVCDTGDIGVVRRFSETITELARGELSEQFSIHDWHQSVEAYNQRIYDKTASLFTTAAEAGARLAGAPDEEVEAFRSYGYNLGMAFQIMDDVLDFKGTEEELGKPVGADLLQGILTLPALLFAAAHPDEPVVRRLREGSTEREDLEALVEQIGASSVIAETETVMDGYRQAAHGAIAGLPDSDAHRSLDALTDFIGRRRS
ncbi:MAG: polyprenyl synthetase family protein [Chloroflexi bacterium]|nr:polyprenyl synthetase family protein [Chloroflexota bacterium]